jgi:hypothetical protein
LAANGRVRASVVDEIHEFKATVRDAGCARGSIGLERGWRWC